MLWNRADAEDATQEIMVRSVTRLAQFDFRSKLKTWVYRVAVNYILDVKKSPVERMHLNFERFAGPNEFVPMHAGRRRGPVWRRLRAPSAVSSRFH